ncbi:hypothetical protein HMPREF0239_04003 [Clostridium sp. ATCC BAA-442]|nr:hypothetical protein HMPREF0239_04003 [Clostridium sp. ATCC BAA-442]
MPEDADWPLPPPFNLADAAWRSFCCTLFRLLGLYIFLIPLLTFYLQSDSILLWC